MCGTQTGARRSHKQRRSALTSSGPGGQRGSSSAPRLRKGLTEDAACELGLKGRVNRKRALLPPEVTLVQSKDGTAVCKAAAGKPAAQISWTPERACITVQEPWGNGTVTVQSTCHWEGHHVQNVSCSVSHLTGNKSLTIQLNQGLGVREGAVNWRLWKYSVQRNA
ncbi:Cell surface glycoprotein CD200 receptor 1 [Camelus dromedarius]|uniref:Cell surface glycoprotein CD200 receptor 1 n=1 Tax=Camelus dromedarius TaxID=9838 RepID=A0A5N4EIW3_CAMDR|nr:Cell surface glycoprotein CD200 receptor 1 [Camelus dromedarius]